MNSIKEFDGKKVEMSYIFGMDKAGDSLRGRIIIVDDTILFFEGKHTRMGNKLDACKYLGFKNIIVPIKIIEL